MSVQLQTAARAFVLAVAVLLALGALHQVSPWTIALNRTPSIPQGLYLAERAPLDSLARHDIVCVPYSPPPWALERRYLLPGTPLCKYLLGLPGERIAVEGDALSIIDDKRQTLGAGRYAAVDSHGRALPRADLPQQIPSGHYYLGVPDKPNSLDSRYLGLAPASRLVLRLYPVWTW